MSVKRGTEAALQRPAAPKAAALPAPRNRLYRPRAGHLATWKELSLALEGVTPIFGGAALTRRLDDVDIIRVPSVRGSLRFWWRALHGHSFATAAELFQAEGALWGRAAGDAETARSQVEVRVHQIAGHLAADSSSIPEAESYALWPARRSDKEGQGWIGRRTGVTFRLTLKVPGAAERQVLDTLRAWLLFGGYGGRTRRGAGCLTVRKEQAKDWLPGSASRAALSELFGRDIFQPSNQPPSDLPLLAGAALHVSNQDKQWKARDAWLEALAWLKTFRQAPHPESGKGARQRHRDGGRPSISNWPEADKVRRLSRPPGGLPWAHPPRHNATPAWPRGGFGLPILGRFQTKDRSEPPQEYRGVDEPRSFKLGWSDADGELHERLASPLIVRALPLADGTFVPCALWLQRGFPRDGQVVLASARGEKRPRSAAPFERLRAPGDKVHFDALAGKSSLREAFLDWLKTNKTREIAP